MKLFQINITLILVISILLVGAVGCTSYKHTIKRHHQQTEREREDKRTIQKIQKELNGDEKKILHEAGEWLGTPYYYGRQDKSVATDCSGFVMQVFNTAIDCKLPRNAAKQAEYCKHISHRQIKAGDLVFFSIGKDGKISHVGIMIDEKNFIHASSSKGVVISSMESNYYKKRFKKYGRVPCMRH